MAARHNIITGLPARYHGFDDNYFDDNIVSRCHTDRIRRVGIRKAAPLPYQPIQIRCVHIVVSHRSDRIVTLLIRRNQ